MSYDLYFATTSPDPVDVAAVTTYAREAWPYFQVQPGKNGALDLFYQNDATGVYFSISYAPPEPDDDGPDWPSGTYATGFSFNVNFFRPTFFALEAMPVAAAFAQRFKWLVLDPQDHSIGGTCQPKPCQPEDLIRTWQLSNAWAVPTIAKDAGSRPPYLPKEKSVGMWHYLRQKAALEERFHAQDIFVPKVFVLQHKTTGAVNTFITWAACIPQLFPVCDFVAIRRERKRLFRREAVQESVLIRFDALMAGIGGTLEPVAGDVSDLRVLLPAGAQKVKARVDALRLPPFDKMYQGVPMDKFVDEPLS